MAAPLLTGKCLITKTAEFAVSTRILVLLIQLISNLCIPDHDAGVFNPPLEKDGYIIDHVVDVMLGGFRRWDAIYFTHVAQYWYTYENSLVFFPFYPLIVFTVSKTILYPFHYVMSGCSVILLSGLIVNISLFIQTAKELFILGQKVLKNDLIAYKAALLFCINPASIFMTAPYSEILYLYLTVKGLSCLTDNSRLTSSLYLGFASVTRSNGLLNTLYLGMKYTKQCKEALNNLIKMRQDIPIMSLLWIFGMRVIFGAVPLVISVLPFLIYQYYCYVLYCTGQYTIKVPEHVLQYGRSECLKVFGDHPSMWCNNTLPIAYSFIQKHHWNQGFLNYWELKQIPNFLLATPVCLLVLFMSKQFYNNNRYVCHTLGLDEEGAVKKDNPHTHKYFTLSGPVLFPFVVHAAFLTIFGIFCIHVQILTRMLFSSIPMLYWYTASLIWPNTPVLTRMLFSSIPMLYWYAACLISPDTPVQNVQNEYNIFKKAPTIPVETKDNLNSSFHNLLTRQITQFSRQNFVTKVIFSYFIGYLVIGTVMFCNFLPWT